jgi:peptidoglycan-associated lipoprotein
MDANCSKETRVFFDFNMFDIKSDAAGQLDQLANCLRGDANLKLLIAGNTDDRGSTEYNMSLGERRALSASDYLSRSGIDKSRIQTISYGEEKPLDPANNESAWAKNRRADVSIQ